MFRSKGVIKGEWWLWLNVFLMISIGPNYCDKLYMITEIIEKGCDTVLMLQPFGIN